MSNTTTTTTTAATDMSELTTDLLYEVEDFLCDRLTRGRMASCEAAVLRVVHAEIKRRTMPQASPQA